MPQEFKTEVELLKRDMELLGHLAEKFDTAIDRLADVSQSVDKMLAIHENRLQHQENQSEIIHQRISDMKKELMEEIKQLRASNTIEHKEVVDRLAAVEKWRWIVVGASIAFGFIAAQMEAVSKIFN